MGYQVEGLVRLGSNGGLPELVRLGVARLSVGGGPYQACLALLEEIATGLLVKGSYEPFLARQLSFPEVQELFAAGAG